MPKHSYSNEFYVSARSELVFNAITKEIDKWWTESSNKTFQLGDQLIVQFENSTSWTMKVVEFSPNHSIAWYVTNANHDIENISKIDEWKGTTIKWRIEESKKGSKILFFHIGLIPGFDCYKICEVGWNYFLGSLKNYLDTGKGSPYKESVKK